MVNDVTKLPKTTGHHALIISSPVNYTEVMEQGHHNYRLDVCTANLGATYSKPGHPFLKHCFAKIMGSDGKVIQTLAFGRDGVLDEPYPDVASSKCETQAMNLSRLEVKAFVSDFQEQGKQIYKWGVNDCCAILSKSVKYGLNRIPAYSIRRAVIDLKNSGEIV